MEFLNSTISLFQATKRDRERSSYPLISSKLLWDERNNPFISAFICGFGFGVFVCFVSLWCKFVFRAGRGKEIKCTPQFLAG